MPTVITNHLAEIEALCRANGIRRLDLFGSAATGGFIDGRSDIDFYVDLGEYDQFVGRRYFRLTSGLVRLFGWDIDVITTRGVAKKPAFQAEVERTRRLLYEA